MNSKIDINKDILKKNIKSIRLSMGLNQQQFGDLFDPPADKSIISRWEKGVSIPNAERLKKIAELGKISVKALLEGTPTQKFTMAVEQARNHLSKEEKFLHARKMLTTFHYNYEFLKKTFEESETATEEEMEIALNFQKALTKSYFETLFTPEELQEWEDLVMPKAVKELEEDNKI